MRIPANNFEPNSETSAREGFAEQGQQRRTPDEAVTVTTAETQAVWQTAFTLSPNVRFTRTPESAIRREHAPRPHEEAAAPAEVTPPPVEQQVQPVAPVPVPVPVPTPDTSHRKPLIAPGALRYHQKKLEEAAQAIMERKNAARMEAMAQQRLMEPLDITSQPEPQIAAIQPATTETPVIQSVAVPQPTLPPAPVAPAVVAAPAPAAPATRTVMTAPVAPRADIAISDHAFWELMPEAAVDLSLLKTTARIQEVVRPAPVTRHVFTPPASDITSLYRVVTGRSVAPAPVVTQPSIEPVAGPVVETHDVPRHEEPEVAVAATAMPEVIVPVVEATPEPMRPRLAKAVRADAEYDFPPVSLLRKPEAPQAEAMTPEALERSAGLLESILEDFGVRGEIIDVRPGPVVTLYEFEPAPGVKSSRVIGLADDIARSMSALSARVAVVPGRNVIGIELPNSVRETVYFRELIECEDYWETRYRLAVCLGKTIGGEPVIAELARMPHLLVAGTTGSGKSVAINTMILSLLYRLKPEECRLIMVDPKMLELSVYDGIPHLLTPVVTDPKKAVMALKWAVREMEDRYRKMSRLGVRNIDGYNTRAAAARESGEVVLVNVQTGFDRNTGEPICEDQEMDLAAMPYIVIIVDEMADLMMVAGKEIEGAIQRLAQMARAAGIHLIMATQRPSVDVITGTIKANFPTRISFQVTSKIDSRTILGEQGAEHLLGQGDMLHMAGGGRIARVHGPFVSDAEVEQVVAHLKAQGRPQYLGTVTEDDSEEPAAAMVAQDQPVADRGSGVAAGDDSDDLYDKAVKVVLRDRKCSTSYIQRRLSVGYNRAASLVERMEKEGLVGPANHVGKREIIAGSHPQPQIPAISQEEENHGHPVTEEFSITDLS